MIQVRDKKIVLFGGSGFLASALIPRLQAEGAKSILAVARNEGNLIKTQQRFGVEFFCGSIADSWLVARAMRDQDIAMNLSAFKHVGLAETSTFQALKSNVVGLMTLLAESLRRQPEAFVFISTDKAAAPVRGVYGASKFVGEKLVQEAERINPETAYRVVRYGNVWGSTGSFVTKWKARMLAGEEIAITDPEATRFFFTADQAVDLIFECLSQASDASPYVPKMKAARMGTVLEACMEVYGMCPVKTIGLQAGESLHETLDGVTFSNQCEMFTKQEVIDTFLTD